MWELKHVKADKSGTEHVSCIDIMIIYNTLAFKKIRLQKKNIAALLLEREMCICADSH